MNDDKYTALVRRLVELAQRSHFIYGWYNCPKSPGGCLDDSLDKTKCNCGADSHNAEVCEIAAQLESAAVRKIDCQQLLDAIVRKHFEPAASNQLLPDAQLWSCGWMNPISGSDTLQNMMADVEELVMRPQLESAGAAPPDAMIVAFVQVG